jgi:hypothetical protein
VSHLQWVLRAKPSLHLWLHLWLHIRLLVVLCLLEMILVTEPLRTR